MTILNILLQATTSSFPTPILLLGVMFIISCVIVVQKNRSPRQNLSPTYNPSTQIKAAGNCIRKIFYCIISQLLLVFLYWFLIGAKVGYLEATGSLNINDFQQDSQWLHTTFLVIELIISITFLSNLWDAGKHLINFDYK